MKRWFCGFSSTNNSSLGNLPQPKEGQILWEGANPFWMCGTWKKQQIITLFEGHVRLAIVGTCLEPYQSLVELFHNAVRSHEYSRLMRLPGSYNLIVQDEADTYVFTDVAGLRRAFYTEYDSGVAYSSLGMPLKQLIKAEVDPVWISTFLMGVTTPSLLQNRSPFCQVQSIPPGCYLQITSGKPTCKRYWNAPQEYSSFSEAAEKLREQLLTAVEGRVRLYGNISSDLSGGFDSTSLALIAAKSLAKRNQTLDTITIKTLSATKSGDVKWAQHAASFYPNISPVMIEGDEVPLEYSNLTYIPLTDAPDPVFFSIGQISYLMRIIASKGSQLHMTGDGGDAVLLTSVSYLADLLKRVRIGNFFQHTYGWSRLSHISPVFFMSSVVRLTLTSYYQWLLQQARKLRSRRLSPEALITNLNQFIGWDTPIEVVSWYKKKAIDLVLSELERKITNPTPFVDSPGQNESIATILSGGFTARIEHQLAENYDVNLEAPYFDSLVIDACLSAKPEDRMNPFIYKPLLSTALQNDLPKTIFMRTTKGEYTADEFLGLRKNLAVINEIFQAPLLAEMDLIDISDIHGYIQKVSMGLTAPSSSFHQTLAIELWLRHLIDAGNSFWM